MNTPTLYGPDGNVIATAPVVKGVPELDPNFLFSFAQLTNQAGNLLKRATEQPYQYYIWVYACASAISLNLSRLQPYLYDKRDPNKKTLEHPLLKLFRRPNDYMTGSQFIEAILLNLMLPTSRTPGGQCFLIPDYDGAKPTNFYKGQIPKGLMPFSDKFVYPKITNGNLVAWELRIPTQPVLTYHPDEVVRIHLYNPYDMLLGMSPYFAALYAIEGDTKIQELSRNFSEQNANVGGLLVTDKNLNKDQANELRTDFDTKYGGTVNSGKTAILHSGLRYEQTSRSPSDLQMIDQRKLNMNEVLAAYKVPKFAVQQYEDINYATSVMAQRTFWMETLIPYSEKMLEPINSRWIENIDGGKYMLALDTSIIEALRADYKDKVLIADTMITKHGVPVAEAYRMLDIPIDEKQMPWLSLPLVIGSRVNLADGSVVGQMTIPGIDGTDPEDDTEDGNGDGTGGDGEEPKAPVGDGDKSLNKGLLIKLEVTEREKFWLGWVKRTLNPGEKKMQTSLVRYMISQRNSMMDQVDAWLLTGGTLKGIEIIRAVSASDFSLNIVEENGKLKKLVMPIYDDGIEVQAKQMEDELGDIVNWKQNSPYVEKYKKQRFQYMKTINTYTFELARKQIAKAIDESITNNLTTAQAATLIKDSIQDTYKVRVSNSLIIARTEMGSIANTTRFSIMHKEGIEKHEWLSARDEKVRADHSDEDGHIVEIGGIFPETGLICPCESGGDPSQVINCRCTAIAVR